MTRLKFERTRRGLTQHTIGIVAHIPQPAVGLIESGRLLPTSAQLERLALALGVPADELLRTVQVVQ